LGLSFAVLEAALAAAMAVTLVGCASSKPAVAPSGGGKAAAKEPVKVGAILSLTGTYAGLGTPEKKVLEMEVARINDAGGVNGRKIDLIIEDDGTDEAKAVAAASKLIDQDKVVAIIGASGTGQSMAIRSEIDRSGVPQVSMAGGTVVTGKFDKLVFQTPWSNRIVVPFVLSKIKADGHTKVAVMSDSGGYGKDGHELILSEAPKAGLTIVADQVFNPGDTDMTAQLTQVRSSGADALLLWTAGKEGAIIVKGASDLGLKLPMYGGSGQAKKEFAAGAGPAADGFIFGTGRSLIPANWEAGSAENKVVSDFAARYEKAYGEKPDIFAGHAFDAIGLVAGAIERANSSDPAKIRDALEATKGFNGFGGEFTFTPTDHNGLTTSDLALYKVEGGTWVTVK
jgi:branched-chain amino acid transport system substrate-binding protein